MKSKKILMFVIAALLLTGLMASGCGAILVPENGEVETGEKVTKQYDFSDFTGVDISSTFQYEISRADNYSVSITAGENMFDDIRIEQEGQTLVIQMDFPGFNWALFTYTSRPKAVITMPELEKLNASGATDGTVSNFSPAGDMTVNLSGASRMELQNIDAASASIEVSGSSDLTIDTAAEDIGLTVSGASHVDGDIVAQKLDLGVHGSGSVKLEGSAADMTANVDGASDLKLRDLKTVNADVVFSGASDGKIDVSGRLDAHISGASSLEYSGNPTLGNVDVSGSSDLEKK